MLHEIVDNKPDSGLKEEGNDDKPDEDLRDKDNDRVGNENDFGDSKASDNSLVTREFELKDFN